MGSAGSGFKCFLGGLALGRLGWNVGLQGQTLPTAILSSGSCCLHPGWRAGSVPVQLWVLSGSGTAPVAVECSKINPHLHQSPLMLIWASCRSELVAAVVRY